VLPTSRLYTLKILAEALVTFICDGACDLLALPHRQHSWQAGRGVAHIKPSSTTSGGSLRPARRDL
jgi:hypothetical protein